MSASFVEYIEGIRGRHMKKNGIKLPMESEILSRWNSRILPRNLNAQGAEGAAIYLRDYGRGISAAKCEALALYAEKEGWKNFALGFWARGYELTCGEKPSPKEWSEVEGKNGGGKERARAVPAFATAEKEQIPASFPSLPEHLIPGKIVTMQPVDAPREIEDYLHDPAFLAQPKRDGERTVIAVEADGSSLAQKRSGRTEEVSPEWKKALKIVAEKHGAFVLDGERYFQDAFGKEHRSGAQAATANLKGGKPEGDVVERYAVFKALFEGGRDLTVQMEVRRVETGFILARELEEIDPRSFEALPTCSTLPTKNKLLERQRIEGREGIVLVKWDCKYIGGKTNGRDAPYVRHKFLKTLDVIVTGLTKTTAAGRAFGAINVAAYSNGKLTPLGSVGTGFTQMQAKMLAELDDANPGRIVIEIVTQGFTEGGQIWHGRYMDVRKDKKPEDCEIVL